LIAGVPNILAIQVFGVLVETAPLVGSVRVRTLRLQGIER